MKRRGVQLGVTAVGLTALGVIAFVAPAGQTQVRTEPAVTSPSAGLGATAPGLRQVHSPGAVVDDVGIRGLTCHSKGPLPDPVCTPGAVDPAVTQATIGQTICKSGWTGSVRPPVSVTEPLKFVSVKAYGGYAGTSVSVYEFDHLVPLELGGANSTSNLWPELGDSPNAKDSVENHLRSQVCSGKMTLAVAQAAIARNWTQAW